MSVRPSLRVLAGSVAAAALLIAWAMPAAAGRGRPGPAPDSTPPTAPANLRATAVTHTSATLAWDPSTDNVGVRSYSLWVEGLSGVQSATAPQTTATWPGLRPGQTYVFRVTAFDAQYNASAPSAPVAVTTLPDVTAPSTPSGLSLEDVTQSRVLLTWTSAIDDFGPVTHQILVNGTPTANAVSTTPAGLPQPAVQGAWVRQLEPGTSYEFAIRAVDGSGNVSGQSNAVVATTQPSSDTVAPTTPTLLSAQDGGTGGCPEELWVQWSASTDDVDPVVEYELRTNGLINEVIPGGTETITYTALAGDISVTVIAVDRAGNASPPSNAITVRSNSGC